MNGHGFETKETGVLTLDVDHGLIHSNKFTEVLTLWARTLRPSAARVTSVKLSLEKRRPKTLSKLFEWLFHLRQNWCDGVILIRVSLRPSIFEEFFVFFFSNLAPNFSSKRKFNKLFQVRCVQVEQVDDCRTATCREKKRDKRKND